MIPLEFAIEHVSDGILFLEDGVIIFCNHSFSGLIKRSAQKIRNSLFNSYVEEKDLRRVERGFRMGVRFEIKIRISGIYFEAKFHPVNKEGVIKQWLIICKPIKEGVIESINRLSEHLNFISETTPVFLWSIDKDLELQYVSEKGLPGIEVGREELIGKKVEELYEGNLGWTSMIREGMEGRIGYAERLIRGQCFQNYFRILRDCDGREIGLTGLSIDVTEHVIADTFKKRLLSILEATSDIVILFEGGEISYINKAGEEFFGGRVIRRGEIGLIFGKGGWIEFQKMGFREEGRGIWSWESRFLNKEEEEVAVSIVLIGHKDEGDGRGYYSLIARDISRVKEQEEELREEKERAERATKVKSDFLANVSHEIRTPLNAILGFSEILGESVREPELKEYTQAIKRSGNNLLNLITDILDLSKIESGSLIFKPEAVKICDFLDEIRGIFELEAGKKGLEFIVEMGGRSKFMFIDLVRLRQIVFNVISNAIKYTEKGHVKVLYEEVMEGGVKSLIFKIKDSGVGIEEKDQEEIFETFVQKHGMRGGVGLGLAITKKLVIAMGGEISLRSEIGNGSEFMIKLPLVVDEKFCGDREEEEEEEEGVIDFDGNRVLFVDDIEVNLEIYRVFFKNSNLEIIEAISGEEAVRMSRENGPKLIIMDLKMPGLNGIEATRLIKGDIRTRDIPIIILTAQPLMEERERAFEAGADGFLEKPITRRRLIEELKKYLRLGERRKGGEGFKGGEEEGKILVRLLLDEWELVKDTHIIGEIKNFCRRLEEVVKRTGWKELEEYLGRLRAGVNAYNIEECHVYLKEYRKFIEERNRL